MNTAATADKARHATRAIKFFGTKEPPAEAVRLEAGVLEANLESGNLRYIRIGGREALRAVAFLVRDRNWGTYNPEISDLDIDRQEDRFTVSYTALCKDAAQAFRYAARIEGRADGSLVFEAEGEGLTDFVTNRTGFVFLHPLEGVVGAPVTVEHVDGTVEESSFPELIDPVCPLQDIRTLTHEIAPGLRLECRMEGDAFETEDHRNWMDASYKTYVRPLAKPWPFTIAKGERTVQRVTLRLEGPLPKPSLAGGAAGVEVSVGGRLGHAMPRVGLAAPAEHAAAALDKAALLRAAQPSFLVCHFDAGKGHGSDTMRGFAELGQAVGAELVLEAVLPCLDEAGAPTDVPAVLKRDTTAVREAAEAGEAAFARVAVSPASDLKCTLPGSVWPKAPGWADLMEAARAAFPGVPVGGGMFSYFTELNRKRPPAELLDFICHSGSPIVHAGDDVTVAENLEALPSIFRSVRAMAGGKPYWVFPTAIAMRDNPYGAAPAENPDNIRQAMNRVDPRERALLGAAWYAGYLAHAARAGVDAVTLAAVAGPSGIVYTRQPHGQPWFDEAGAQAMPSYHVLAGHGALAGGDVCATTSSDPRHVQALGVLRDGRLTLWLSNLSDSRQVVAIDGASGSAQARLLHEGTFESMCLDPVSDLEPVEVKAGRIELPPFAVTTVAFG